MLRYALASTFVPAIVAPAFAADTFYIVQDKTKKTCTVTKTKPTSSSMVVVNENGMFKTETEAKAAMKKTKVCVTK